MRWHDLERTTPELTASARRHLDANRHKVLATLRTDGSPRVSGTEVFFVDGDLWIGAMPGSVKVADLRRDPRCALHGAPEDPGEATGGWHGDAKLDAVAHEADADAVARIESLLPQKPPPGGVWFRLDVDRLVVTELGDPPDHLVVTWWTPVDGTRSVVRR